MGYSGYRLKGDNATEFGEDIVIYKSEHDEVIDDIENRVGEALKHIEKIEGLDNIDDCKGKLIKLLEDLY